MISAVTRDAETAEFFDHLAERAFPLRRCRECSGYSEPQAAQCSACGAVDLEWAPASGRARVVSWAVVHQRDELGQPTRALIAIGELAEGPWWWAEVIEPPSYDLQVGDQLEMDFVTPDGGAETVPVFRTVHANSSGGITKGVSNADG